MSQMQRRGLPHASFPSVKVLGACAMLLTLTGCTELARFIGKAEPKPEEPVVAEQPTPAQTEERVEGPVEKPKPSKLYEWNGDGRKVSRIVIDTDKQRASFFVGEDEIGWSTIASGLPKHPTPTGRFAVMEKVENKRSNLYGKVVKNGKVVRSNAKAGRDPIPSGASFEGARMPYFMRLTYDGIGLHAGPIPRPGQPASHGCIRLPSTLAPVLFKHVSHGTEVTIVGSGPSYGNYVEKQRIAAARAKREAEKQRIAQANAAAANPGADAAPAAASATPRPPADSRPAQQAATTAPDEPPTVSDTSETATDPATAPTASTPESSTAAAAPPRSSPTSDATPSEVAPTAPVTAAPTAPIASPANAPRTVAEPAGAPDQAESQPRPTEPPETKTTTIAETAGPADDTAPPSPSSAPTATQTPAAPASDPAPAAEAQQSPPSTGSEASQAPAPAAAPPAAPPAQAQQAPAAAAEGSEG